MNNSNKLKGVFSPVLTPFNEDCAVDSDRFIKHCKWLIHQDVGLAIFGTNSEATSLSIDEKIGLLDGLIESGLPPERMMPGVGSCSLPDTVRMTRHMVNVGCAGVLMLPPFYYKNISDEGLYRYFSEVIESVGDERLRVYLYHIPPVSQVPITFSLIEQLLKKYPQSIAGVKDSSGDWENTATMLKEFQPQGFDVFAGSETFLLKNMQAGGVGCITATGNVNPGPIVKLYQEWKNHDSLKQQQDLDAVRSVFAKFPMIAAMKAAIAWKSGRKDWRVVRPPLIGLSREQSSQLENLLSDIGFKLPNAASLV